MVAQRLSNEYARDLARYERGARRIRELVEEIVERSGIPLHSITARAKNSDSLRQKLSRVEKGYTSLDDITDLIGVRVITHLAQDVGTIGEHLSREFEIDWSRSVDKRTAEHPDRFGYTSLHYIASLGDARAGLSEYRDIAQIRFEIQVRSILQHAWAEIEHDLGYKTSIEVPFHIRRRFSRLAGLLELADSEFDSIRQEIDRYRDQILPQIGADLGQLPIDADTLGAFTLQSELVGRIDAAVAATFGRTLEPTLQAKSVANDLERLRFLGIGSIGALTEALAAKEQLIGRFAREWVKVQPPVTRITTSRRGIAIYYLGYVLCAAVGESRMAEYLDHSGFAVDEEMVENLVAVYRRVAAEDASP